MMDRLKPILESLLFVADEPLALDRLAEMLTEADKSAIRNALRDLAEEYDRRDGGICLTEVAGGFQIRTRPEYHPWVRQLLKPPPSRLSRPALETLAIIAYKQPIIRADIEHIRGVDCGGVLRMLLEKKLIRVLGRRDIPGRPMIYGTTRHFLEVFELKDLKDLPSPKEIEALGPAVTEEPAEAPTAGIPGGPSPPETADGQPPIDDRSPQAPPAGDGAARSENGTTPSTDIPEEERFMR
jgi:segregation and condensation protein B